VYPTNPDNATTNRKQGEATEVGQKTRGVVEGKEKAVK
jgi:hypothetical protein